MLTGGSLFARRFEIDRLADAGGMGAVYRAWDREGRAWVALKVLHATAARDDEAERFEREARLLAGIAHPAVVAHVAHGRVADGPAWLAMEWLDGLDLAAHLAGGPLAIDDAAALAARVGAALAVAHGQGVIHRDVKPSNVFVPGGDLARAKLLDFGVARPLAGARGVTQTGAMVGTPGYMAPEQTRGRRDLSPAADVFSLGCVLYECLTGQAPFVAEHVTAVLVRILFEEPTPVEALRPGVSPALAALLRAMLAKDPSARPPDAGAVVDALAALRPTTDDAWPAVDAAGFAARELGLLSVVLAARAASSGEVRALLEEVRGLGAAAEQLADGTVFVSVAAGDTAIDQATLAARAALLIKGRWPSAAVSLATGRGAMEGRSAAGDVAEQAARALARGTGDTSGVMLDGLSARLLEGRFAQAAGPTGSLLLGEERVADATRPLLGRPTPCVGRDAELASLLGQLAGCVEEGEARAVLVTGAPGVGKSRLRHELLRRVAQRGEPFTMLSGRGDPRWAGRPYGLLGAAIRALAGVEGHEPPAEQRRLLDARVGAHVAAAERERVTLFVGELCGAPAADEGHPMLAAARREPKIMGDRLRRAALDWLAAECARGPVMVLLDDLQWGDAVTVSVVDEALREQREAPLFVLALARPEVHAAFPRLLHGHKSQEVALKGLSARACERLVRQVLGGDVPAEAVARAVTQSGGNALFLEELIRSLAEGEAGARPDTVLAMLQARIGQLAPEPRRAARAAAVFGQTFWRGGVARLLGHAASSGEVGRWLEALAHAELIEPQGRSRLTGEEEYGFRHALVREAAYALLTEADLRAGHRLAAAFLEAAHEADAAAVADHCERAGEAERAAALYLRAAESSLERGDLRGVARLVERGVACGAAGELLGELHGAESYAQYWLSEQAAMGRSGDLALGLVRPGSRGHCRALQGALARALFTGDRGRAAGLLPELLAVEPDDEALPVYIEALHAVSLPLNSAATPEVMGAVLGRLAWAVERVEPRSPTVRRYLLASRAFESNFRRPRQWSTIRDSERALALARQAGDVRQELLVPVLSREWAWLEIGDVDGAHDRLRALEPRIAQTQEATLSHIFRTLLAYVLCERGDEASLAEAERAVAPALASPDLLFPTMARGALARVALRRSRPDVAEREGRVAMAMFPALPLLLASVVAVHVRALAALGREAEACAAAEQALAVFAPMGGAGRGEVELRVAAGEAFHAVGETERARAEVAAALREVGRRRDDIDDPVWRERYLTRNRACARALALAAAWGLDLP